MPFPPLRKLSFWKWTIGAVLCIVLIAWLASAIQTTIPLESGPVIVIDRVTYGESHKSKPPLLATIKNQLWGSGLSSSSFGGEEATIGLWMTSRTRWLHRPANFEGVHSIVLVDRDGWPHASGPFEEYELTLNGGYMPQSPAVDLTRLGRGNRVGSMSMLPQVRPDGPEVTVAAIDEKGRVLGMCEIDYPAPLPAESDWTPDELPVTKADGDLSVTLHDVEFGPPPPLPDGAWQRAIPGVSVRPRFEVRWKGEVCEDCWTRYYDNHLGILEGPLPGHWSRLDSKSVCDFSPFEPAWVWKHHFYPGPTADFDGEDLWRAGSITIPPADELVELERSGRIRDLEYGVVSVAGPGQHTIQVDIGQRINLHHDDMPGVWSFSGRRMPDDSTIGTYDITTEAPFLIVASPPVWNDEKDRLTPSFHAILRNGSGEVLDSSVHMLSWVQWTQHGAKDVDHPREYWIVFLPREALIDGRLELTFAQYRMRQFSFYFRPPSLDFYRQHGLLPLTMEALGD
jgi:hypothetical protein